MKRIIIFIFMFVMILGSVAYAERVDMEYPSYLPIVDNFSSYFIVKDRNGKIYLFGLYINDAEYRVYFKVDGENLDLQKRYPQRLYHYVYDSENNEWDYVSYSDNEMTIYGYEILYTTHELYDNSTGEVFFPIIPPTLEEITAESVEEIPGTMAGTMRKMFPAGFGIVLGIVLARSLKVLYRYF